MEFRLPTDRTGLLRYEIAEGVEAFSTLREAELPYAVLQGHQTHDDKVVVVSDRGMTRADLEGVDALVTQLPDFAIGVRTADCVPVLLYDPVCRAIAAVHAGWKGTVRKIASKALTTMYEAFNAHSEDVLAVIGPSIGFESFQVGPEVAERFVAAGFPESLIVDMGPRVEGTMEGGLHIDLWEANRWLLVESGVPESNILVAGIDTYARNDLFFSARREGIFCGRIINAIKLVE